MNQELPECVYRVSVKAIIKNDAGKIMLLKEESGVWDMPGGGLDHSEKPKIGLSRELEEEIGCQIQSMSDSPTAFWTIKKEESPMKWFSFVAYDVKISGEYAKSDEAIDVGWFSPEEARELPLHPNSKGYFLD